ncbi:hypothetical protein J3Q64DRAFT_1827927 [Phycomyces blakesleeanus]|uniref:Uncharacterized protein n=2 Tax=Phycomyces blakesleeanus TaxID=4837 RepID=A0A162TAW2_PHYB8|nr:hypothetical protein PHYBLDRAFT_151514 [Phycomyces blakesleeanus NRRL 1555(-)]OAD67262.1 hypothetical protein PHYBLDRAFT_151514 [Phycomyces blakesleeanus NRRL 1555(-)]|eukprot:XP_018285302.1 hypothetical protein PHYBLDRAFT_151514 [Phycomyces blakesleeanus NRRL 1555(-)]
MSTIQDLTTQTCLEALEATMGNNIPLENIGHLLAGEQEIGQVPNDKTLQDIRRPGGSVPGNSWKLLAVAI